MFLENQKQSNRHYYINSKDYVVAINITNPSFYII